MSEQGLLPSGLTDGMIDAGLPTGAHHCDSSPCDGLNCDWCRSRNGSCRCTHGSDELDWLDGVKVGYDSGFVIASQRNLDLQAGRYPYRLKINGWGQLRHTISDDANPNEDLNQFQLKRGRIIFSGNAFTPDFSSGSTEFDSLRVVDSGRRLANLLPAGVESYYTSLWAIDTSLKYRGWSATFEYYFRNVRDFRGAVTSPDLLDQGFWFQLGYFAIPRKLQLLARWSRVDGNSGTLGLEDQSAEDIAGGIVWYFRDQHANVVADMTYLDGAPINSAALDISPRDRGWLYRTQVQFSF